jgi:hypothetical protein
MTDDQQIQFKRTGHSLSIYGDCRYKKLLFNAQLECQTSMGKAVGIRDLVSGSKLYECTVQTSHSFIMPGNIYT